MRKIILLASLLMLSTAAWSGVPDVRLPASVREVAPSLHLLGAGHLNWLFFSVYNAALWITGKNYDPQQTFALGIDYQRSFSRRELVKTSLREMRRLDHLDAAQVKKYQSSLRDAFPNVKTGDQIVGLCVPGKYTAFYFNGILHSTIDDPQFCPDFFAIWLNPKTRVPDLRKDLLGTHD